MLKMHDVLFCLVMKNSEKAKNGLKGKLHQKQGQETG